MDLGVLLTGGIIDPFERLKLFVFAGAHVGVGGSRMVTILDEGPSGHDVAVSRVVVHICIVLHGWSVFRSCLSCAGCAALDGICRFVLCGGDLEWRQGV
jgi:hypothetical protein